MQNLGGKDIDDLRPCARIDRRPERHRSGGGITQARGGQGVPRSRSGAKTDRAQLRRVLDELDAGDVLMVTRLDRLARSTRDLLNTLAAITAKKAGFKSLGDVVEIILRRESVNYEPNRFSALVAGVSEVFGRREATPRPPRKSP